MFWGAFEVRFTCVSMVFWDLSEVRLNCVLMVFWGAFEVCLKCIRNAFEVCSKRLGVRLNCVWHAFETRLRCAWCAFEVCFKCVLIAFSGAFEVVCPWIIQQASQTPRSLPGEHPRGIQEAFERPSTDRASRGHSWTKMCQKCDTVVKNRASPLPSAESTRTWSAPPGTTKSLLEP